MLALYRGGRHADALATLQDHRRTLDEELGLVPSAALGELERRILHHDPSLLAPDLLPAPPRSEHIGESLRFRVWSCGPSRNDSEN